MTGSKVYDYSWSKSLNLADLTLSKMNDSNAYWVVDYYPNTNASDFIKNADSTIW